MIGFVGLSHLGIVSSVCWASMGWEVIGVDTDVETVSQLTCGRLPIHEPRLAELFTDNHERLKFSCEFFDLSECDIVFVSLDTETDEDNRSDLSKIRRLIEQVIPRLTSGVTVVLMSQVPVGFTRKLERTIRATRADLKFKLYHWVETLVIGNAVERCLKPERIILGCSSNGNTGASRLEGALSTFDCPVLKMSYESSELTKAAINLYLSCSVTFANVMADLCEATGASMNEIVPALRLDRRIGKYAYIQPSLGIAGGNLERDLIHLRQLSVERKTNPKLFDYILDYNTKRYQWVHEKLKKYVFSHVVHPKMALWGLAYKRGTKSTKNSFAVKILHELQGKAELYVYDPVATVPADLRSVIACGNRYEALAHSDCLVVLTDWEEFARNDWALIGNKMRGRVVIDCMNVLDRAAAVQAGFCCFSIGVPHE